MARVIVFAENLYEDSELLYPYYRMQEAGFEVDVVAPKADTVYQGKKGTSIKSTRAAADIDIAGYEAIIIPGGYSPDLMRRDKDMVRLVRQADEQGKVVAAICHAGWMLAEADIVRGRRVTSFFSVRRDVENAGARWEDREVVVEGNLVTSRQPADLPAFCREILKLLERVAAVA